VTTEPNAAVAPVHNRMPLALEPGEAALWLRGVYEPLLDRGAVRLTARPER
ncbi:MAG: SOS response-associated peptidase family protein, partial [Eggerthella lenta]